MKKYIEGTILEDIISAKEAKKINRSTNKILRQHNNLLKYFTKTNNPEGVQKVLNSANNNELPYVNDRGILSYMTIMDICYKGLGEFITHNYSLKQKRELIESVRGMKVH